MRDVAIHQQRVSHSAQPCLESQVIGFQPFGNTLILVAKVAKDEKSQGRKNRVAINRPKLPPISKSLKAHKAP